jgi:hypothetical protein
MTTPIGTPTAPTKSVNPLVLPVAPIAVFVVCLIVGMGDPLFSKSTFDQVNNDGTKILGFLDMSSAIAIVLYGASVIGPIKIGLAEAKDEESTALTIGWLGLGAALFCLRWFETVLVAGGDWSEFQWMQHLPVAVCILFLYVLTGYGFRYAARELVSSTWHRVQPIVKRAANATGAATGAVAIALHAGYAFDANRIQASLWSAEFDAHQTRIRNAEAEVKDHLRVRLAEFLANPSDTGLIREPHRHTNAVEKEATDISDTDTTTER